MKTVTVKNLIIGEGMPKIIVSLMGRDINSVKAEALAYREATFDILEWRVEEEMVLRLRKMQALGADIPKIAVMPQSKHDVLTLLTATLEMQQHYAEKQASAPGQIAVNDLRSVLMILHNA